MSKNVVRLDRDSVSDILLRSRSYVCAYVDEEGVGGFWNLDPASLSSTEWLALIGRMSAFHTELLEMYNKLSEQRELVEL